MKNKEPFPDHSEDDDAMEKQFPGYPPYPQNEDIYNRFEKEEQIDPEDPSKTKAPVSPSGEMNEKDFDQIVNGDDLDVPGAELDDPLEDIGSEDEENNYYSLGGDNHTDLEEREDV